MIRLPALPANLSANNCETAVKNTDELRRIVLAETQKTPDSIDDLSAKALVLNAGRKGANDPSSATRRTGRNDCNHDAPAGFAAAHG